MVERCIMIFPEFKNGYIIDELRNKYDPLAQHVRPHITLVFPFESDIKVEALRKHIETALVGMSSFNLTLQGIIPTKSGGNYLFMEVINGADDISEIHDRLYTSILEKYYRKELEYIPHMTIGKLPDEKCYKEAIKDTKKINYSFKTKVNKLSVEIIDCNKDSIIEFEYELCD